MQEKRFLEYSRSRELVREAMGPLEDIDMKRLLKEDGEMAENGIKYLCLFSLKIWNMYLHWNCCFGKSCLKNCIRLWRPGC